MRGRKLATAAVITVAAVVSVATSLPRVSDEKRGEFSLTPNTALRGAFDVRAHTQASVDQDLFGTCRVTAIEGLEADQAITIRARITSKLDGEVQENEKSFTAADVPAGSEEWELPAVGAGASLGCDRDGDCLRSFDFECERTDELTDVTAKVSWQVNATVVFEAPLFSCEQMDVTVEVIER